MDLTVIGASGGTGSQVVAQALTAGHRVTAVVRDPAKLPPLPSGDLSVVTADVLKADDLRPAIRGRDAVITALGPRGAADASPIVTPALQALIEAMWAENVTRVVLVSNSGMHTTGDPLLIRFLVKPPLQRVFRHAYADAIRAETLLESTDLEWTIARPPRLTNGRRRASYRTATPANVRWGNSISRADLADFLLRAAADPGTTRRAVSLAY